LSNDIEIVLKNILTLQTTFGVGSKSAYEVLSEIIQKELVNYDFSEIISKINISDSKKRKLKSADYKIADKIIKDCKTANVNIITILDENYPNCLKNTDNPPLALFFKGNFPDFDNIPTVSIVGPRKVSDFGKKAAFSLGYRLAKAGMTVVSGGALGADSEAHYGAIKANGTTVAVLGCGIGADYLNVNKPLREKIANMGCLISEYPPFTPVKRYSFPIRNRIISGLSLGTIVIEASEKSGALITARHALDQGRDVFVIPGNPTLPEYLGSNRLLSDGAKPLINANDVFSEYISAFPDKIDVKKAYESTPKIEISEKKTKKLKETLPKEAKIVYNYLDNQIFTVDDLSGLEISPDELLSALTELELEGLICPLPGGKYKVI